MGRSAPDRPRPEPPAPAGGSRAFEPREAGYRPPLVGLAHGSRHPGVRPAIDAVLAEVTTRGGVEARTAFLDLAEPDLATVAKELAAARHRSAVVVPLLFTAAFHATVDVPAAVAEAAQASGVDLTIADILGTGDDVAMVLWAAMADAGITRTESVLLYAVGSSRPQANAAVADLAARLAADRPGPVEAGFGTCDPRAEIVLAGLSDPVAVLPLFLAPGLLLDPLVEEAAKRGWTMAPPLGVRAVDLVLDRYRDVTARAGLLG